MDETSFLSEAVSILSSVFIPDVLGNTGILFLDPSKPPPLLTKLINPNPPPKSTPPFLAISALLAPYTTTTSPRYFQFAVLSINGHSYAAVPHQSTLNAIAIALYHREPTTSIKLQPAYLHYRTLSAPPTSSTSLSCLAQAIRTCQKNRSLQKACDDVSFTAAKPSLKKLAGILSSKVTALRKQLDSQTTLAECWATQKLLDRAEVEYDATRLKTIPSHLSIKLVGDGFKVGVGALWMEQLTADFTVSMAANAAADKRNPYGRACVTSVVGSAANPGSISFRANDLYLKSDNFPTLRLETFEAKCEFTSVVPIHFKSERQRFKVGPGLKVNIKKISSKMTTAGGLAAAPPQTMIRFATEQVLRMIIVQNIQQFFPPEIGMYLEQANVEHTNGAAGTLKIAGPNVKDLEAQLANDAPGSQELLNLSREQAQHLVSFARAVPNVDVTTVVKLVQYYKDNVVGNQNRETARDLVAMLDEGYELYRQLRDAPAIDMQELFNRHVLSLSENPIKIRMEFTHIDVSIEMQPLLECTCRLLTRLLYETFGGMGVVGSSEETDGDDEMLRGIRRTLNRVFIPLRRAFYNVGKNVKRVTAEVDGSVVGKPREVAKLSLAMNHLQILCTPSMPTTFMDFMTRQYETTCRTVLLEDGRRRFKYKMMKEEDDDDEEEDEEELPKFVLKGHFEQMRLIVAYDPAVSERGNVKLGLMPSYHGQTGLLSEESLRKTCEENAGRGEEPLLAHFTADAMTTEVALMAMVPEMIAMFAEFLKWGGASFDKERKEEEEEGEGEGEGVDERMLRDLRDKFQRILVIVLKIVHKHTSTETFNMVVSSALRVSSNDEGGVIIEVQGNSSEEGEKLPLSLEWTTTFVDIVEDMKKVIEEFRRGGKRAGSEGGEGGGGGTGRAPLVKEKSVAEELGKRGRRMSEKFGAMFSSAFSSPAKGEKYSL